MRKKLFERIININLIFWPLWILLVYLTGGFVLNLGFLEIKAHHLEKPITYLSIAMGLKLYQWMVKSSTADSRNLLSRYSLPIMLTISIIAGLSYIFWHWAGKIPSSSVDIAHGYALIKEYLLYGERTLYRNYLGEMNIYPGGSHWLVAKLSLLYGKDIVLTLSHWILAMQLLFLFSIFILAVERRDFLCEIFFLLSCIIGFGLLSKFGLGIGNEVKETFFFSQLTGDAITLFLFAIIFATIFERVYLRLVLVGIVIWAGAYIHLMSVLSLLTACLTYPFIEIIYGALRNKVSLKELFKKHLIEISAYGLLFAALVFSHPSYSAMKQIAKNDGWIGFSFSLETFATISTIVLILLSVTYIVLFKYSKVYITGRRKMLIALYCGSVLMMLAQWFLLRYLDVGSPYAVKKHFFGIAMFMVPCLVGASLDLYAVMKPPKVMELRQPIYNWWAFLFLVILISQLIQSSYLSASSHVFPYARLREVQNKLARIPNLDDGKTLFIDNNYIGTLSYLINIGDLHAPRDGVMQNILIEKFDDALSLLHLNTQPFTKVVLTDYSLYYTHAESLPNLSFYDLDSGKELTMPEPESTILLKMPHWENVNYWYHVHGEHFSFKFNKNNEAILKNQYLEDGWASYNLGSLQSGYFCIKGKAKAINVTGSGKGLSIGLQGKPNTYIAWKDFEEGIKKVCFYHSVESEQLTIGIGGWGESKGEGIIYELSISGMGYPKIGTDTE